MSIFAVQVMPGENYLHKSSSVMLSWDNAISVPLQFSSNTFFKPFFFSFLPTAAMKKIKNKIIINCIKKSCFARSLFYKLNRPMQMTA